MLINTSGLQVISQIRSLTASLFGIAAGILGLESLYGFIFYFLGTVFVSQLITASRRQNSCQSILGLVFDAAQLCRLLCRSTPATNLDDLPLLVHNVHRHAQSHSFVRHCRMGSRVISFCR